MARFTVLTIALCSAVSFLLGAVLSGRTVPAPAPTALSAEPVAEYGPILRSQGPGTVIPVGYTDTVFGYLPSARMLGQHGYEDEGFMAAFGIAGRFRPDIEPVVRQAWGQLSPTDGG